LIATQERQDGIDQLAHDFGACKPDEALGGRINKLHPAPEIRDENGVGDVFENDPEPSTMFLQLPLYAVLMQRHFNGAH
jgi:hypothetical protein